MLEADEETRLEEEIALVQVPKSGLQFVPQYVAVDPLKIHFVSFSARLVVVGLGIFYIVDSETDSSIFSRHSEASDRAMTGLITYHQPYSEQQFPKVEPWQV